MKSFSKRAPAGRRRGAVCIGMAALVAVTATRGQTPGAIAKPWTYEGSMRLQQEERDRAQRQQQGDAGRRQADADWQANVQQNQARSAAAHAEGRAVLQAWQQRPPLSPERNPLLGRWHSQGNGSAQRAAAGGHDMASLAQALVGGMTAGLCDNMLGRGLVEFRPNAVVAIAPDGRERVKYHAQYRGGGARVVVLPQDAATFTHMIVDLDGSGHATVAGAGCGLARAEGGAASTTAAVGAPVGAAPELRWDLLGRTDVAGGMDLYVARAAIRRSGNSAQMWDLFDFKGPQTFEGKRFLSARNRYEYDCAGARRRMLATTGYADHMGRGPVVASSSDPLPWERVPVDGPARATWKVACGRAS